MTHLLTRLRTIFLALTFPIYWFRKYDWEQFAFGLITQPLTTWRLLKVHLIFSYADWKHQQKGKP